jgi:nucleoside phosphorylase/CheY-like chemotaxis protein
MISILMVDDNPRKISDLRRLVEGLPSVAKFETATSVTLAKRFLVESFFDLLILDLSLPIRDGDDPFPQNGRDFLEDINRTTRIKKPVHIIGFSEFDEYIRMFSENFEFDLWALVKYDITSEQWQTKLLRKIDYLVQAKLDLRNSVDSSFQTDLAILAALRSPELDAVLKLPGEWRSFRLASDGTEYFKGTFRQGSKAISVVAACTPQMGMVATAVLANKVIQNFRPRYITMVGIAGGVRGVGNLGDILIADLSFDSGSGKIKESSSGERIFEPDFRSIDLDSDLRELFLSCKGSRQHLDLIKTSWPAKDIPFELNIQVGPLATGAGVIANKAALEEIRVHSRKLIGIDMESYALFYTWKNCSKPRPLAAFSIKSVSDFGDSVKDDKYQSYSSYTSANFLYQFALTNLFIE